MEKLENQLQALYRNEFQEVEIIHPYPVEWETMPYPPNYKLLTHHSCNGKGSLHPIPILFLVANKSFDGA